MKTGNSASFESRKERIFRTRNLLKAPARDLLNEDGSNRNLGPTESIPADEAALYGVRSPSSSGRSERTFGQEIAAEVLKQVVTQVVAAIDWDSLFKETVAPAIRRTMGKTAKRLRSAIRRPDSRGSTEMSALASGIPPDASKEISLAVKAPTVSMSSEEYRERVIATLAADAYAAWQREMLSNAHVEDDDLSPELTSAINLVLEGNTSSLDEDTLASVMKFIEGFQTDDDGYAPLRGKESGKTLGPPTE